MLIAWKSNLAMDLNLPLIHTLTTILRHTSNTHVMITNVYGPQTDNLRLAPYEELRLIRMLNDLPWIVIEDFNLIRSNDETSGAPRPLSQIDDFNDVLKELHLTEVPLQGRDFTYSNGNRNPHSPSWIEPSSHSNGTLVLSLTSPQS
jgi:hypothetical protein